MLTMPMLELAGLLILVLCLSVGAVLWLKNQKRKPNPMLQLLVLVILLVLGVAGMKWGGEALGILPQAEDGSPDSNAYRQALLLLQEPYPTYTSANNLASTNRETLSRRFQQMELLELADLKTQVSTLRAMIDAAPATGQPGIYNMRITSDIQARWDELRRLLLKRLQRSS